MNGIEAWITSDDKRPFPIYGVKKDHSSGYLSCWIPFEPGANFSIRWRDMEDMLDISGFVTMDGCHYGGRLIRARSFAPAVFSRIPTSATQSRPLSFPFHPPNYQPRSPLGGTIVLDIHMVASGETRIHRGLSDYAAKRAQFSSSEPLFTSLVPTSSTEVDSLGKVATFVFYYRTPNFLRAYGIAPIDFDTVVRALSAPHAGDKRSSAELGDESDDSSADEESTSCYIPGYAPESPPAWCSSHSSRSSSGSPPPPGHLPADPHRDTRMPSKRIRL